MSIPELLEGTQRELDLTRDLVGKIMGYIEEYPSGTYNTIYLAKLEHSYKTLENLNSLLTEMIIS